MIATIDLEYRERELHTETARLAAKHRIPGVAVGVEHEGRRTYAFYGSTSIENPLPVDSRTLFQVGSNTKTFTATAVMQLVERGIVDLHAPVCRYVPDLRLHDPDVAERVTVLQLLNHTAGWSGDFFGDTGQGDDALERYVARLPELEQESPLGWRVSYNNAAFSTAGHLIEKMTGMVYEQAVRELVIDPLGLEDTVFPPGPVLPRRYAVGHFVTKDGSEVARRWLLPRSCSAAGTLLSTPADMLRYARFHRGDGTAPDGTRLLSRASLDLMKRPTASCPGNALGDAIGVSWLLREVDGMTVAAHGGGTNGQISAFQTIPERGFAIAVLTNASTGGELTGALLEWVLQRWLGIEPQRYEPMPASDIDPLEYAGTYQSQSSVVRLEITDGKLLATPERTEVGKRWSAIFAGQQAEKLLPPPFKIELLDGERIRPQDGPPGPVGSFVREDGDIVGLTFGGRFARRT